MAAYVELLIDQGTTFVNTLTINDDVTNNPINIALYSVSSQMRRSYYSANASANLECTITDAANGVITMSMSAANTWNVKPGRYVFDVLALTEADTHSRLLEGIITVTPGVTH
jgi:hypothetical protein